MTLFMTFDDSRSCHFNKSVVKYFELYARKSVNEQLEI